MRRIAERGSRQIRVGILLILLCSLSAQAEDADPVEPPAICTGYDAAQQRWGFSLSFRGIGEFSCPEGSVVFAVVPDTLPLSQSAADAPLIGSCCPLPKDALSGQVVFADAECPDGFVASGSKGAVSDAGRVSYQIRCSEINTAKYSLGPRVAGWILGPPGDVFRELGVRPLFRETKRTVRAHVPVSIRFGLLREARYSWSNNGCIGYPWGSILVGRRYHHCSGLDFRELQVRRRSSFQSKPAAVFRRCARLDDPFSPNPRCLY